MNKPRTKLILYRRILFILGLILVILNIGVPLIDLVQFQVFLNFKKNMYRIFDHLFGSKETMWVAITGIDTAIAITIPLIWDLIQKSKTEQDKVIKYQKSLKAEILNNIDIIMSGNFGLEVQTQQDIYKEITENLDLIENPKKFEAIHSLYNLNHHYNQIVDHKLTSNIYIQLSISKTKQILDYYELLFSIDTQLLFNNKETITNRGTSYGVIQEIDKLKEIYTNFINDNDTKLSDFHLKVKEVISEKLKSLINDSQNRKELEKELLICSLFDESKEDEYNSQLTDYANKSAGNYTNRMGNAKKKYARFHRSLKKNLYPPGTMIELIQIMKDKIAEKYRSDLTTIYKDNKREIKDSLEKLVNSTLKL